MAADKVIPSCSFPPSPNCLLATSSLEEFTPSCSSVVSSIDVSEEGLGDPFGDSLPVPGGGVKTLLPLWMRYEILFVIYFHIRS